jgi:hypothetical protein
VKRVPLASQDPEPESQEQVSERASQRCLIQMAELGLMGVRELHGRCRGSSNGRRRRRNKDYIIYLEK